MSSVIIDEVKFYITFEGKKYYVNVQAQDIEENDMYCVSIYSEENNEVELAYYFNVDSGGGYATEHEGDTTMEVPIVAEVMNYLFIQRKHGVIRGF